MTVANNYAPVIAVADSSTTSFSGSWNAIAAANLVVQLLNTTTGAYTTVIEGPASDQYQVTTLTGSGFTIAFNTAPATGNNVVISRDTPIVQTVPYTTSRGFQGSVEEGSFDSLTAMIQENASGFGRSLHYAVGTETTDATVAEPVDQSVLMFSGTTGLIVAGPSATAISGAAAAAAAAAASASSASSSATAAAASAVLAQNYGGGGTPGGRMTLSSGVPATIIDVTGAGKVYYTPYVHNQIRLYDGTNWHNMIFVEMSLTLAALTNGLPYDLFMDYNLGAPILALFGWASSTARTTALAYQDGVLVKSGASTQRYLGTFVATSTTTTEDSQANRYTWNYYNRLGRAMFREESTASWTYTTAAWRQANNNTANQLNFVVGVSEEVVDATLSVVASNTSTGVQMLAGIAPNRVTSPGNMFCDTRSIFANDNVTMISNYKALANTGINYLAWLEWSGATGTTTWVGGSANATQLVGNVRG